MLFRIELSSSEYPEEVVLSTAKDLNIAEYSFEVIIGNKFPDFKTGTC